MRKRKGNNYRFGIRSTVLHAINRDEKKGGGKKMKGSYKIGAKGAIANPLEALVGVAEPRKLGLS